MAQNDREQDRQLMRRSRQAALVMSVAMIYWIAAQMLGSRLGWDPRWGFVFDITTILALLWAMWIVWKVYQARRAEKR